MGSMIDDLSTPEAVQARSEAYHRSAIHEAGHCVAAWLSGCLIEYATLHGGEHPFHMQRHGPLKRSRSVDAGDVFVLLGGAASEQIHGFDPWPGAKYDLENLADVIAPPDPETQAMREFLVHHPGTDAKEFAEYFLPSIIDQLSDPKALACIRGGAAMIENAGKVSGRLLVELFEFTWGSPLPDGVFGHEWHPAGDEPEKPTAAQALVGMGKALAGVVDALEKLREAHGFENADVEALAGRYLENHFWMQDKLEIIELKGILKNETETQGNLEMVGTK